MADYDDIATVEVGDVFEGSYTFDLNAINTLGGDSALYPHASTPAGFSVTVGQYSVGSDPAAADFEIFVVDAPRDYYRVRCNNSISPEFGGEMEIEWELSQEPGVAFDSAALPASVPDIGLWNTNHFQIRHYPTAWLIQGTVDEVSESPL